MKLIAEYDQHKLGFKSPEDRAIDWIRRAARAVLTNDKGQVAVMHFTMTGSYKLPGGGIDDGESIEDALRREVREEAGYEITDVQELGVVEEDRYYCGMHQTSYCFAARVGQFVGTELTDEEAAEGMELVWVESIDEAIAAIQAESMVDEDGNRIGHEMMKLREVAILRAAQDMENRLMRQPKIIVLRGNSGSGKSTLAYALRQLTDPMAIVIEQDHFRQKIVAQKGEEARDLTKKIIHSMIQIGLDSGRDIIVEGIFRRERWQDLFDEIVENYQADKYFFYFDISLDETMRRHATRLKRHEFDADKMQEWFKSKDFLNNINENIIDEQSSFEASLQQVKDKVRY